MYSPSQPSLLQSEHGKSKPFVFWQYYLWRVAFPDTQCAADFLWNHYSSQVIDSSDNASCSHVVCPPLCPTSVGRLFRVIMNQRTHIYVKIRFLSEDGDFFRKKQPPGRVIFSYLSGGSTSSYANVRTALRSFSQHSIYLHVNVKSATLADTFS